MSRKEIKSLLDTFWWMASTKELRVKAMEYCRSLVSKTKTELVAATAVEILLGDASFTSDFSAEYHKYSGWQEDNGPSMAELEETVLNMNRESGQPRPISAVVGRLRRGKTHMLHELTRRLNQRNDTVAVMIGIEYGDKFLKSGTEADAMIAVSCLILSKMLQGQKDGGCDQLNHVLAAVEAAAQKYGVDFASTTTLAFAQELLRALIVAISERHSQAEGKTTTTKFVLLVDDIHRLDYDDRRIPSLLSDTIVSTSSGDRVMQNLDGFLVLSSSNALIRGMKRHINPLMLPTHLDADQVVRRWLPRVDPSWTNVYETDKLLAHTVELVISTVIQVQHVAEIKIQYCLERKCFAHMVELGELPTFFHSLILCRNDSSAVWVKSDYVPTSAAHRYLFKREIETNKDTVAQLHELFFADANAARDKGDQDERSVWNLMTLSKDMKSLSPAKELLTNLMARVPTGPHCKQQDVAGMVSAIVRGVINLHMSITAASSSKPQSTLNLAELFHVRNTSKPQHRKVADLLGRFGTFPFQRSDGCNDFFMSAGNSSSLPSIRENGDVFLTDADNVLLNWESMTAKELALYETDAEEGRSLWMLRNPRGEAVALFVDVDVDVDCKSRPRVDSAVDRVDSSNGQSAALETASPDRWQRARHIAAISERASQRSDWEASSLAEALAAKRYLHVQLRAGDAEGVEAAVNEELNAVVLGADVVQRMMGPFETVYRSALRFGELCGDEN